MAAPLVMALAVAWPLVVSAQSAPAPRVVQPILAGDRFPAAKLDNLNRREGQPPQIDLAQVLGKKPMLLCYWIAGYARSEEVLQQVQALAREIGPDKLAVYGMAVDRPDRGADVIQARIESLGIDLPILRDVDYQIGQALMVRSVPHLTLVDRDGRMRLTNGASLVQTLEYQMDVAKAARRLAETGKLGTYGHLGPYFPVKELVGQRCPDFSAPLLSSTEQRDWASLLDGGKLNVLIFWSVDCPHCRKSLPEINAWLKEHSAGVNVVSAATVGNPTTRTKTKEFCDLNGFVFPTLEDVDRQISEKFHVTSTPTIVLIRPDGTIDSVLLSDAVDIGKAIEQKRQELVRGS